MTSNSAEASTDARNWSTRGTRPLQFGFTALAALEHRKRSEDHDGKIAN
jgi:hypothetical protein